MAEIPKVQIFRPTWQEFTNIPTEKYIEYMESKGAHIAGIAIIIPPDEWKPRKEEYTDLHKINFRVIGPQNQVVTGSNGFYQISSVVENSMDLQKFSELSKKPQYETPAHSNYDELEEIYWGEIKTSVPLYGTDTEGTLFNPDIHQWNLSSLGTILDLIEQDYGAAIPGVNKPFLYFGMWKTLFAWHTEDMDLYSLNLLHFGAPKTWYAVPPKYAHMLEKLARDHFPDSHSVCPAFLRHKMTVISPEKLKENGIPFNKITQEPNQIIVTFPLAYHMGFNNGFNCAEAVNFATLRWIEYGKRAEKCLCDGSLNLSMDTFVKKFQPNHYDAWLNGCDIGAHPENLLDVKPAPLPSVVDVLVNKNNSKVPEVILKRLLEEPKQEFPEKLPFKLRNPDVDLIEILAMNNIPKHVKSVFSSIYRYS